MWGPESGAGQLGWTLVYVLGRVLPLTLIAPYLGGRFVPGVARLGLGLLLGAVLVTLVPAASAPPDALTGALALTGELLLGAAVGFVAALVVYAALMAGAVIDAARGERDPLAPDVLGAGAAGPVARALALLTIAVFLALNGHHLILRALVDSFESIPPGEVAPAVGALTAAADELVLLMGRMFVLAVAVSLPVLVAVLIVALTLGLASRVAPRLHAFFLALPLRSVAALFVLLVGLAVVVDVLVGELGRSAGWIRRLVEAVGG